MPAVWHLLIDMRGYSNDRARTVMERKENNMARRARAIPKSPSKKVELTYRDCLRCDRVFPSEGPYNRLCKTCLEYLSTSPTPAEEYSIGYL